MSYAIDKKDFMSLSLNGIYERLETDWIRRNISNDMVCIDVGASIGYHTLLLSRYGKEVFAFEPFPEAIKLLKENIKSNNIHNIRVFNLLAGNKKGNKKLYINQGNFGANSVNGKGNYILSEENKIDNLNLGSIDFVKIDAEGYDLEVIQGMAKTLSKFHPVIMLERVYYSDKKLQEFLARIDYNFFCLGSKTAICYPTHKI